VPLEGRAEVAERLQLLLREVAELRHRDVHDRDAVALREHEAITVGPERVIRAQAELVEEQRGDHVRGGERPSGVAGAGRGDGLQVGDA
jgi:hypothetical protein